MSQPDSVENLRTDLENIDQSDPVTSAECREEVQEVLADTDIPLSERTAIADQLIEANQLLTLKTVGPEEGSY